MDQQALLQATSLVRGRLLKRRNNIKKELVRYCLSLDSCPNEVSTHRLVVITNRACGVDIDQANITSILGDLSDEDIVEHKSGDTYLIKTKPEYPTFEDMINPVWMEFTKILEENKDDLELEYLNKSMKNAFENFFVNYFIEISESSEDLAERERETIFYTDTRKQIEEIAKEEGLRDKNTFIESLSEYLQNPGDELASFVANIYSGLINIDLISREEYIDFSSMEVSKGTLLLDTNVLVALLCESDRLHPLASSVCSRSSEMGFNLRYTQDTKDELRRLIRGSESEMSGLSVDEKSIDVESSQFVKDFRKGNESSWDDYVAEKKNWSKYVTLQWNVEEIGNEATFDPETFNFAESTLKQLDNHGSNGANRNENSIDHDARLLTYIDGLRENNPTTPAIGPYALSFDNLLTSVSEIGTDEYWQERAVIQPRKWLNYLLAFTPSSMSNDEKRETSIAVIQSTTNFEDTLSVGEYTELLIPKIQLESDDKEVLTDYLISHPKSRELQNALDHNRGSEAEQTVRDMLSDENRLEMFSKQRDMESKLKNVRGKMEDERKRADNERKRRKAIEEAAQTDMTENGITINVNTSAVADTEVNNSVEVAQFNDQLNNFIRLLDSTLPTGIEQSKLPDPPKDESDLPSVKQWLSTVSAGLATEGIAAHAGALQPMAQQLLDQATNLL